MKKWIYLIISLFFIGSGLYVILNKSHISPSVSGAVAACLIIIFLISITFMVFFVDELIDHKIRKKIKNIDHIENIKYTLLPSIIFILLGVALLISASKVEEYQILSTTVGIVFALIGIILQGFSYIKK